MSVVNMMKMGAHLPSLSVPSIRPWLIRAKPRRPILQLAGSGDSSEPDTSSIQKYGTGGERKPSALSARSSAAPATAAPPPLGFDAPLGVAALILLNCAIFVAATVFQSNAAASLAINPAAVKWLSFLTSALVHHSAEQLGRNMFIVFFFSQMVYRDLGAVGVWFTFLLAGLGANLSSWAFLAGTAKVKALSMLGVASSGGTLGIFLAAMALSCRPSLAWLLGAALSGNFVLGVLLQAPASAAAAAAAASGPPQASLMAYLGDPIALVGAMVRGLKSSAASPGHSWVVGAVAAAAVVVFLARLPDVPETSRQ